MQVVLSYDARSYCLQFERESFTWKNLINEIFASTSVPLESQRIIIGGKHEVDSDEQLQRVAVDEILQFVQLKLRLLGGKVFFSFSHSIRLT
jgi:hypothetical protein